MDYSRPAGGILFGFGGMNTVLPPDALPQGKHPVAVNIRAYLKEQTVARFPQGDPLITVASPVVHSLRRLNDSTPLGPASGYALISGAGTALYVDSTQVQTGLGGERLAMVSFRPNASPQPWMYISDYQGRDIHGISIGRQIKVNSTGTVYFTGIEEPQTAATAASSGLAIAGINVPAFYRYVYRSSATGAVSNPSPPMRAGYNVAGFAALVTMVSSTDPQVDKIDLYRFSSGLLDYTYVGTAANGTPFITDSVTDAAAASNPLLEFDNFQPFPSIDLPKNGVVQVTGANTITYSSGDLFNVNMLPGNIILLELPLAITTYNRPTGGPTGSIEVLEDLTPYIGSFFNYSIAQPVFANQVLPSWWGPTDNAGYFFACGDPLRQGTLYFTKGNNPDSAPDTNQIEVTSPSEPLMGGCIVGGLGMVFSSERAWLIYPNFSQAVATVVGVQGTPFNLVESISERGLFARQGICTDGGGWVYFITKDGIRKSPAGSGSSSITDDDLYNLFPHEGIPQTTYTVQSSSGTIFTLSPPDYGNADGMALRFSQGYVYFDYIGLDAARHTLVYDTINNAWSVDVYTHIVAIHADNEGEYTGTTVPTNIQTGIGTLMGCTDSTIRNFDPAGTEAATALLLTACFNNGDKRSTKRFTEVYFESSAPSSVASVFGVTLYADRYTQNVSGSLSPLSYPQTINGLRQGDVGSIANGEGIYVKDIGLAISVPVASVGCRLFLWQPAFIPQPETTTKRVTDWDDGGTNGAKFVQGVIVEADSLGVAKSFNIESGDDHSVHTLAEMGTGVVFDGQSKKAFSLATPFVAHNFRLLPDAVNWNLFKVEWIFVPYPELVEEWHTEGMSHGITGWQHVKEVNVAHISTADLTLTLKRDFGSPISVTIPNSGGVQTKTLVQIPPPSKFKIVSYNITSSAPFRLWEQDLEVWVAEWEGDAFTLVKPFGGPARNMFTMPPGATV